jgi:hypothetical protein
MMREDIALFGNVSLWFNDRLPTQQDGDLHGMVLWGKQAGLLMSWQGVRPHEWWAHSSAWGKLDGQKSTESL